MNSGALQSRATAFDSFMRDLRRGQVRGLEGKAYRDPDPDRWGGVAVFDFGGRLTDDSPELYDSVWNGAHPTEKPVPLLKELIQRHSKLGDLVLDPFAGSGSTLEAAFL